MIYFSIDIETNGLAAGINSMISLGCAAIDMTTGALVEGRKYNLVPLSDLFVDKDTMNWWKQFPEAYAKATENPWQPKDAMRDFHNWVKGFNLEHPVAAAWKPAFDIAFVRYYLIRFIGQDIFGRTGSGLDIKTLTAVALNQLYSETQIATVDFRLKRAGQAPHNHDALDDAIEQGYIMYNARKLLGVQL